MLCAFAKYLAPCKERCMTTIHWSHDLKAACAQAAIDHKR
jgi:hypothetical protein